jgi:hypothetical protein
MGRGEQLGGAATEEPIPHFRLSPKMMTGADDVLMLVEQLDMASFALYEES